MSKITLATDLYRIPGFQRRYQALVQNSVQSQFNILKVENNEHDWNYLLLCASILAASESGTCLDAAFRIAQYCMVSKNTDSNHKVAAALVMDSLTNTPSINLSIERKYLSEDYESDIPLPLLMEKLKRGIKYSIYKNDSLYNINKFQWEVYNVANSHQWVSVSAPTSAGKSFILMKLLEEHFTSNVNSIAIFIVPTRALIQQVEFDIYKSFSEVNLGDVYISSIPALNQKWRHQSQVYVLTQERLLWILNDEPEFTPDIVIIDEAQKIGDGSRGILLQQSIEELASRSEDIKFLFSSPLTENPDIFLDDAPRETSTMPITSEYVAVNQNLIWVSQVPRKPMDWEMSLCQGNSTSLLGMFRLENRPSPASKRLPFVAFALADKRGGNLIYVNGPAEAEKVAMQLWDLQGKDNETDDTDIFELIDLSSKTINKLYSLNVVLKRRVAFHYGNMPILIKSEIENLFKSGKIKFLVCTST